MHCTATNPGCVKRRYDKSAESSAVLLPAEQQPRLRSAQYSDHGQHQRILDGSPRRCRTVGPVQGVQPDQHPPLPPCCDLQTACSGAFRSKVSLARPVKVKFACPVTPRVALRALAAADVAQQTQVDQRGNMHCKSCLHSATQHLMLVLLEPPVLELTTKPLRACQSAVRHPNLAAVLAVALQCNASLGPDGVTSLQQHTGCDHPTAQAPPALSRCHEVITMPFPACLTSSAWHFRLQDMHSHVHHCIYSSTSQNGHRNTLKSAAACQAGFPYTLASVHSQKPAFSGHHMHTMA